MDYSKLKSDIEEIAEIAQSVPEAFREKCFELLLSDLLAGHSLTTSTKSDENDVDVSVKDRKKSQTKKSESSVNNKIRRDKTQQKKKTSRSNGPKLLPDLNLAETADIPSLRDFYSTYAPKSNFEYNLIFVYYLQEKRGINNITSDHIFTCYRNIPNLKIPEQLRQSLFDTKSRKGWLDTSSLDDIKLTVAGTNYLEHDIEKSVEGADE